jgi:hypothetical protein
LMLWFFHLPHTYGNAIPQDLYRSFQESLRTRDARTSTSLIAIR